MTVSNCREIVNFFYVTVQREIVRIGVLFYQNLTRACGRIPSRKEKLCLFKCPRRVFKIVVPRGKLLEKKEKKKKRSNKNSKGEKTIRWKSSFLRSLSPIVNLEFDIRRDGKMTHPTMFFLFFLSFSSLFLFSPSECFLIKTRRKT